VVGAEALGEIRRKKVITEQRRLDHDPPGADAVSALTNYCVAAGPEDLISAPFLRHMSN
jgi:hypothetical protein